MSTGSEPGGDVRGCAYTHHRDDVPTGPRIESMSDADTALPFDDDGYWHCPHETVDGHSRCVFHCPDEELGDVDYTAALLECIRDGTGRPVDRHRRRQFVGLTAPELDLSDLRLTGPDNFPLDLRCADVGALRCGNGRFEMPVDLRGSDVDELRAEKSRWSSIHAQHATLGTAAFDRATVDEGYFEHVTADRMRFYFAEVGYANLHYSEVDFLNFMYADLGEMGFFDIECELATFYGAGLSGGYLDGASFGYVNFESVSDGSVDFDDVDCRGASFDRSSLSSVDLGGARFERATFEDCTFGKANFDGTTLGVASMARMECDSVGMRGTTFVGSLSMEEVVVDEVELAPRPADGERGYVSLRGAELWEGRVEQPDGADVVYDLEEATLGEVVFAGGDGAPLVDLLRFLDTGFEQFDFRRQEGADLEAREYDIHAIHHGSSETVAVGRQFQTAIEEVFTPMWGDDHALDAAELDNTVDFEAVDLSALPESPADRALDVARERARESPPDPLDRGVDASPDPGRLESTYLRAKNGAADVGNTRVAGRFFERERKYRRRAHWRRVVHGGPALSPADRLRFATRGARSKLLSVTCGYGERPWRVVGSSVGIVVLFAAFYAAVGFDLTDAPDAAFLDYLVFSGQNFVTFIVGTTPNTSSVLLRAMSVLEGFLGAFFVGLFVFALTRTVYR